MKYKTKDCLQCGKTMNNLIHPFGSKKYCSLNCGRVYRYNHNLVYKERVKQYQRDRQRRMSLMKLNVKQICSTSPHP